MTLPLDTAYAVKPTWPRSVLRIFDRMSRSELVLYIAKYGVDALPRLTNHTERIKDAMRFLPTDDPVALEKAIKHFQEVFDAAHRNDGPPRSIEPHQCAGCGHQFYPLKLQLTRGNPLFCSKGECRVKARQRKKVA